MSNMSQNLREAYEEKLVLQGMHRKDECIIAAQTPIVQDLQLDA